MNGRRPDDEEIVDLRRDIASRLEILRHKLYGPRRLAEFAASTGMPKRSVWNWLRGTAIPAEAILRLIIEYDVEPRWLLTGDGPMLRDRARDEERLVAGARQVLGAATAIAHEKAPGPRREGGGRETQRESRPQASPRR